MLWSIVKFYLAMDLAGFLTAFIVMVVKETKYAMKTGNTDRTDRFAEYLCKRGLIKQKSTAGDWVSDIVKWITYGYYLGFQILNEYYNFLAEEAEQQKEKA